MGVLAPLFNSLVGQAPTHEKSAAGSAVPVSGVTNPLAWLVNSLGGSTTSFSANKVGPDNAMRSTAVLRAVSLLSETVGMIPLILYQETEKNGQEYKARAKKHPAYAVVTRRPNPWQSAYEFWRMMMMHVALRGNAFAWIMRDEKGDVRGLFPVHPNLVQIYRNGDGTCRYEFRLWFADTQVYSVTQDNMMHLRWMSQDGYVGLSPVQLAAQSVGVSLDAEEYGSRFFSQGAKLSGIISLPGKLNDDAQKRAVTFWNRFFDGMHNAHKVAVLSDGADFKQVSISPKDSQFLELRQFQVDDIARIYGVPPHMIGSMSKSTTWGSGLEQQTLGFLRFTIKPHLAMIAGAATRDLLLPNDEADFLFKHDESALLDGDMQALSSWASSLYNVAAINPNEIRARMGLNPYEGGDQYRAPVNTAATDGSSDPQKPAEPEDNENEEDKEDAAK